MRHLEHIHHRGIVRETIMTLRNRLSGRGLLLAVLSASATASLALGLASFSVPGTKQALAADSAAAPASATFVQRATTTKVSYSETNSTLLPLRGAANAAGTAEIATTASGAKATLVPAARAFAGIRSGISQLTAGNRGGAVIGSLYSYYNSAYGQILPSGNVKLKYQGTPVWMFTAPLAHFVNDSVDGPLPNGKPRPALHRSGCSYIVIVDAKSGTMLTWWEHCNTGTSKSS
jgi:hypothetical protein